MGDGLFGILLMVIIGMMLISGFQCSIHSEPTKPDCVEMQHGQP